MNLPYGWNELDGAIYRLGRSKSALPEVYRQLTEGELCALMPYHPEIVGETMQIQNGSPFQFQIPRNGEEEAVALFSSPGRAEEWMKKAQVPNDKLCTAEMNARQMLEILGKMNLHAVLNPGCATGTFTMPPDMMRDLADGSALQPHEPGETVEQTLKVIDAADYPTDLIQPLFEVLRTHLAFRAAWVLRQMEPTAAGGTHWQFLVLMNPRDAAPAHDLNVVLVHSCPKGDEVSHGYINENDDAYIASLFRAAEPFYVAPDFVPPGVAVDVE